MPIKKHIHRVVQPSDRVLRPLLGRKLSVEQTFNFIEELIRIEEKDTKTNMSRIGLLLISRHHLNHLQLIQ